MKTCGRCNHTKPPDAYWADRSTRDGLQGWCKACRYAWERENKPVRKAIKRRSYLKHQKDRIEDSRKRRQLRPNAAAAQSRKWYAKNRDFARSLNRKFQLRRRYGLTVEEYEHLVAAQGGVCAICGSNRSKRKVRLVVDHDHDTGAIRGMLCVNCNTGLGCFADSPQYPLAAVAYLAKAVREVA